MKVLLASTTSKYSNGASKCLIELAKGMNENGIEVIVTLPRKGELEEVLTKNHIPYVLVREFHHSWCVGDSENISFLKKIVAFLLNKCAITKVKKIIQKNNIDIVHMNALTAYTAAVAGQESNKFVVYHIREFMEDDLNAHFVYPKWAYKIINKSNIAIAISKPIEEKWRLELDLPITVINDGLPIKNYYVENIKDIDTINVIIYGRITKGKGQLFFVKAINRILPNLKRNCHFYFAGTVEDEQYFNEINKEIVQNNLSEYVTYLGEVSNIKNMLKNMHISCVCSEREGFGRVTVESMLGKCLVIGSNTGATTEIISNGKNGILYEENNIIDFSNKLESAINTYEKFSTLIENAQIYAAEMYSIEKDINNVIEVYQNLVNRGYDL